MNIAEKILRQKKDFDDVYDAGKRAVANSIDGMYRFFSNATATGQNMELIPYVLERDWQGANINMQYAFQGNEKIKEFTFPETIRVSSPHGMFSGCKNLKNVSGFDKVFIGVVLTDIFSGCTSLEDCGTLNFEGVTYASNTFKGCVALKEVRIIGTIGLSVSFGDCIALSKESITSIINALSETLSEKTITFSKTAINTAFGIDVDDETTFPEGSEWYELRNSRSNWTFSYV